MTYSLREGLLRSGKRAVKVGIVSAALVFLTSFAMELPAELAVYGPLFATVIAFLEKLERNYRETKNPTP